MDKKMLEHIREQLDKAVPPGGYAMTEKLKPWLYVAQLLAFIERPRSSEEERRSSKPLVGGSNPSEGAKLAEIATPLTDAATCRYDGGDEPNSFEYVDPEDMRALERKLAAQEREHKRYEFQANAMDALAKLRIEYADLREQLAQAQNQIKGLRA